MCTVNRRLNCAASFHLNHSLKDYGCSSFMYRCTKLPKTTNFSSVFCSTVIQIHLTWSVHDFTFLEDDDFRSLNCGWVKYKSELWKFVIVQLMQANRYLRGKIQVGSWLPQRRRGEETEGSWSENFPWLFVHAYSDSSCLYLPIGAVMGACERQHMSLGTDSFCESLPFNNIKTVRNYRAEL